MHLLNSCVGGLFMVAWALASVGLTEVRAVEPFTVITYNIRYQNQSDGQDGWNARKETVLKTIHEADLVGLQEVVASQYDYVRDNSKNWNWYGVGRSDGFFCEEERWQQLVGARIASSFWSKERSG